MRYEIKYEWMNIEEFVVDADSKDEAMKLAGRRLREIVEATDTFDFDYTIEKTNKKVTD
jgi:hypothetical protein|tara:strand:+ start:367 stop:543 length:177 start_codon:yes stop_codon:yes gene_type:complete